MDAFFDIEVTIVLHEWRAMLKILPASLSERRLYARGQVIVGVGLDSAINAQKVKLQFYEAGYLFFEKATFIIIIVPKS